MSETKHPCGICGDVVDTHTEHVVIDGLFKGVDGEHFFHGSCWTNMEISSGNFKS